MDAETQLVFDDAFSASTALATSDTIDSLVSQYKSIRARCEVIADFVQGETAGAMHYFLSGNAEKDGRHRLSVSHLFQRDGAVAALDAAYWSKAMQLTDVLDAMPQKRRDDWHKQISEHTCPEFDESVVRGTFEALLAQRAQFLAERVDGIFRGLSGEHVTNSPQGFGKRMIIAGVLTAFDTTNHSTCGLINDLRAVVAKFTRRGEPKYNASQSLVASLKGNWGEWVQVDGGALKIRLYRKGTAHMEVHPDMAWRLNSILAHLHPRAIAAEFRERPKRKAKDVPLVQRPLPFAVVEVLAAVEQAWDRVDTDDWRQPRRSVAAVNAVVIPYSAREAGKHVLAEVEGVLESLGGVKTAERWQFDYPVLPVLKSVVTSGCLPDDKAHQFYPTPRVVAAEAVRLADITPQHRCLEPSAGLGGVADLMPTSQTKCVEVSALRCEVLRAKGYDVECADFLAWAASRALTTERYDRIVMNPPFDQGRWQAHLEAAAGLLAKGGRLVAVVPASAKGRGIAVAGCSLNFDAVFDDAFVGASVSVVLLVVDRKA